MIRSLLAIICNTFTEAIRQPIYGVVIAAALLLLIFSPSLVMFTIDDDNMLLKDIGLSTLMVSGLFLAVFAAATVVTNEIENKTVLTVVSKSINRSVFVIGKFVGIALAVLLAEYFLVLALFMIVRHGVMSTASDEFDTVVITFGSLTIGISVLIGLAGNYFYRWRFSSSAIFCAAILATISIAVMCFVDSHWKFNPSHNKLPTDLIRPVILTMFSTLILTSIAVAAAMRLHLVMTLVVCSLVFLMGTMMQYLLGPVAAQSGPASYLAWTALTIFPSINVFTVNNAIYNGSGISAIYIGQTAAYAGLYTTAIILLAIGLFHNRQLG